MSIAKDEMQQFYDEHKSQMEQPEQIRLSEIADLHRKERMPRR